MKELESQLEKLYKYTNEYYKLSSQDGSQMLEIAKKIASILLYLAKVKSDVHYEFQLKINELTENKKSSVARAENIAHCLYPENYKLRQILKAGYEILNIIRSQVSYLKQEMNNINN
jgi:hypothetical protein